MTDWEVIEQHVQNMEEALAQLRKYQNISYEEFKRDLGLIWIVEKGLEILVQNLLDIGRNGGLLLRMFLAAELRDAGLLLVADWGALSEGILKAIRID